jgi:hypothetical protein
MLLHETYNTLTCLVEFASKIEIQLALTEETIAELSPACENKNCIDEMPFVVCSAMSNLRQNKKDFDVGCGPIFSMNTTMGVNITCEMLTNSPAIPLLPMQQISTLWIFATPHTCACSRRPRSSLQSTNSQWNNRLHLIFRIEITRSQQSGGRKILQIETKWNI